MPLMPGTHTNIIATDPTVGAQVADWVNDAVEKVAPEKLRGIGQGGAMTQDSTHRLRFAERITDTLASEHSMDGKAFPPSAAHVDAIVGEMAAAHVDNGPGLTGLNNISDREFVDHYHAHGIPAGNAVTAAAIHVPGQPHPYIEGWLETALLDNNVAAHEAPAYAQELAAAIHENYTTHGIAMPATVAEARETVDRVVGHIETHAGPMPTTMLDAHLGAHEPERLANFAEKEAQRQAAALQQNVNEIRAANAATVAAAELKATEKAAARTALGAKFKAFFKGEGSEMVDGFKGAFKRAPKIARVLEEVPHGGNLETTIIGATLAAAAAATLLPELGAGAVAASAAPLAAADNTASIVAPLTQEQQAWVRRVAIQDPAASLEDGMLRR